MRVPKRAWIQVQVVIAVLLASVVAVGVAPDGAEAQNADPTIGDTARLLGYLWADGSYDNGIWDATGPSGGSDIIQRLVIDHGGTWVDRTQLKFTLPAPYDWAEWKDSVPDDDARTREAARHPNFLAALLEGEGSVAGLVYDQSSCCTAGFTEGRLIDLEDLLVERGFQTTTLTYYSNANSGRIDIGASEFAELRLGHEFVCPALGAAIRVPGAEDFAAYGPIRWFQATSDYGDVVRTDCVNGQAISEVGAPIGACFVTSDGNGDLRLSWSFQRGVAAIRRDGSYVTLLAAMDQVYVDSPTAGTHSYTLRVTSDGLQTDANCGTESTTAPFEAPPVTAQTCAGRAITHFGTSGDDTIQGTAGDDVIHGSTGNDIIYGLQGNDTICGGFGDDTIYAGKGNDQVLGGQGFDVLYGAQGNDLLQAVGFAQDDVSGSRMFGGAGDDTIEGSDRWDRMQGGPGVDVLVGYKGRDWMRGGTQNDVLWGNGGIDDMYGGNGDDFIQVQDADIVRGGAGADGCLYASPGDRVVSCEVRLYEGTASAFITSIK